MMALGYGAIIHARYITHATTRRASADEAGADTIQIGLGKATHG